MVDIDKLEELAKKATPGEWNIWFERAGTEEEIKVALCEQVDFTPEHDRCGGVYMIDASGKCPALTGCGPKSRNNAEFISGVQPSVILDLIAEVRQLRALIASASPGIPQSKRC